MNKEKTKIILSIILLTSIPAILTYLSKDKFIFSLLESKGIISYDQIENIQKICMFLSVIIAAGILPFQMGTIKFAHKDVIKQRDSLIKMNKEILKETLITRFSPNFSDMNIRIFVPKYPKIYKILDLLHIKKKQIVYKIKNITLIAQEGMTGNLEFQVEPKVQGLVGVCYLKHSMVYDDNLSITNNKNYDMTNDQIQRTSNLEWIICCPILDNNDKVIAIISFDGTRSVSIKQSQINALSKQIYMFSRMLYDAVPEIFRG